VSNVQAQRDRETLAKARGKYPNKQVRKAFLRYEVVLDNNKTTYRLQLTGSQVAARAAERRLAVTDAFFVTEIGFYLATQDARRPGTGALMTYPSPAILAPAYGISVGAPVQAATDLEAFYAGMLQLTIDKQIEADGLDLRRARFVPQTQAGGIADKDEVNDQNGLISMEPGFELSGTKVNELLITIPAFTGGLTPVFAATAANQEVIGVVIARGYEVAAGSGLSR
jgi:hypothetical protein